jgi:hypothetical protein
MKFCWTTPCHILEDSILHSHHCENLKSNLIVVCGGGGRIVACCSLLCMRVFSVASALVFSYDISQKLHQEFSIHYHNHSGILHRYTVLFVTCIYFSLNAYSLHLVTIMIIVVLIDLRSDHKWNGSEKQ